MIAADSATPKHDSSVTADLLAERFAAVCAQHGTRTAVTFSERSLTYRELHTEAEALAAQLRQLGAAPGSLIAISLERGFDMIVAMLAVVLTGAAYMPLDPTYPPTRLAETLADACPLAVIGPDGIVPRSGALSIDPTAAYVIYTSGSTGSPKGVVVSRHSLLRLFDQTEPWFHFTHHDVWTMFHSFAFDFSVWEIWGPLLTGGRLVLVPFAVSRSPADFHALLVREQVTVLSQTPSAFALLNWVDARAENRQLALRLIVFGGESLSIGALGDWLTRHGDHHPQLINMYGITETTVHVTYRRILLADSGERESLIGEPIPDLGLHLLDDQLEPVPAGQEGELCIAGPGVALGYLRRPQLTAERFVPHPTLGTLYRSGDIGRRRPDGELIYLGRRDGQVKIAGFRIELGEVEAALTACPGVEQACALSWNGRLVAFLRGSTLRSESVSAHLGAELGTRVPAHLRPALYRLVEVLPLTINGKADRALLARQLDDEDTVLHPSTAPLSPENPLELVRTLWQQILALPAVRLDDNFFDIGGTSLLLVRVRAELAAQLGREIPIVWMFEATTVRTLAARLTEADKPIMDAVAENARRARMAFGRARNQRGIQ